MLVVGAARSPPRRRPVTRPDRGSLPSRCVNPVAPTWLKIAGAIAAAALGLWFLGTRALQATRNGEEGLQRWFYDESEQRLYRRPASTVPPDDGIGGRGGDGFKALVVRLRGTQGKPGEQQVAYLETCSPALKEVLEGIQKSRAAQRPYNGLIPARDSDFVRTNSLVKLPGATEWVIADSPEGAAIMSLWRTWRSADGTPATISVP